MKPIVKKSIAAFVALLAMAGTYGAVIALCNRYLRENELITPYTKFIIIAAIVTGFYFIYRWFSNRVDTIAKEK